MHVDRDPDNVPRPRRLADLKRALAAGSAVWLWGESGSGKSLLLRQLDLPDTIKVSVPPKPEMRTMGREVIWHRIATSIAENSPDLFPSGRVALDGLRGTLRILAESKKPHTLVLDHLDRALPDDRALLTALVVSSGIPAVMVARHPPENPVSVKILHLGPLEEEEVGEFVSRFGTANLSNVQRQLLRHESEGNPLKLRALLTTENANFEERLFSRLTPDEMGVLRLATVTRGFIDLDIFCSAVAVAPADVRSLIKTGLLQRTMDSYACHDIVIERMSSPASPAEAMAATRYWVAQFQATPSLSLPSHALAESLAPALEVPEVFEVLPAAAGQLYRARSWTLLERLHRFVVAAAGQEDRGPGGLWVRTALLLADLFVRSAKLDVAASLIDHLKAAETGMSPDEAAMLRLLESEQLWWYGDYATSIEISNQMLGQDDLNDEFRHKAYLNLGIAYWFWGRWDLADEHLGTVSDSETADSRTRAWGQVMLASSLGQRGLDLPRVRTLYRAGAAVLTQVGDDAGAAGAWGNYGEVSWRNGDYSSAEAQLARALSIAADVCGPSQRVEMLRSVAEIHLRRRGPWSPELAETLDLIDSLIDDSMGPTHQMQLWNTLARIATLRGRTQEARVLVENLRQITSDNLEYDIYTNSNEAMIAIMDGDANTARPLLEQGHCVLG